MNSYNGDKYSNYWTRTPYASDYRRVNSVMANGRMFHRGVDGGQVSHFYGCGVRPGFYLAN